jgi:molecular chaperone DnaK
MAPDNKSLGRFILDGIPPAPRGVPQVEVTFDVDANGILNVKAKDKTSGKEQSIRIEASSGLSKEEIAKMQADAEANAAEDEKKKEAAEAKNGADQLIHTAEKALKDAEGKIGDDVKKEVMDKISELKAAKDTNDVEKIKSSSETLNTSMMKIGEAMKTANEQAQPNTDQNQGGESAENQEGNK